MDPNIRYREYQNTQIRDHDMNNNLVSRIFDQGTNVTPAYRQGPLPVNALPTMTPFTQQSQYPQTAQPMSQQYLAMKHAQEHENLVENPTVNQLGLAELKRQQVTETNQVSQLSRQMQMKHANKYQHLKYMSPDVLNRAQGRPVCENIAPVLPPQQEYRGNDVFEQTSYYRRPIVARERNLQQQVASRCQQILKQPTKGGLQSYDGVEHTSSLEDAYR